MEYIYRMFTYLGSMSVTEWLIFVIVLLATHNYLSRLPWKRLPPGPISFPVIGSLPYLGGDIRVAVEKLRVKYGAVFMVYMGPVRTVIISGHDAIKEALVTQAGDFDGRSAFCEEFTNRNGVTSSDGDRWKEARRIILTGLRDFGLGGRPMEVRIQEESQHMMAVLQDACGRPYKVEPLLKKAVSNIISVLLFGVRWEYDDPLYAKHIQASDDVMEIIGANNPVWTFTNLKYIPGDPFRFHKALRLWGELGESYRDWIAEHQTRIDQNDEPKDVIGIYLKAMNEKKKTQENTFCSVAALEEIMKEMYLAGTDTTSGTLLWCLLHLILNPTMQDKIQDEIDTVIGGSRLPMMRDRNEMPYTEAFISEIQRWCDLLPIGVHHAAKEERVFRGYTIPKDTMVLLNMHSVHWDPKLWPNPSLVDPERFLENGRYQRKEALIPFSMGNHQCLGENLAKMELFVFLVHMLQTFTFRIPPNQPPPSTEGVIGLTYMPKPFDMIITPRV